VSIATENRADLLVTNGRVLTLDESGTEIMHGAVAVGGDRIIALGPSTDFDDWQVGRTLDAKGGLILPGLINTHTHAAMTLFRGLADDLPLMTWLNDHIFPAEAKLDPEMVRIGTTLACAEMIRSGTTCFCDMYLFEGAVAEAASSVAMRAVVGEVLYDFPSPNYGPIEKGFEYTRDLIARWRDDDLITIAVEPHSPYLCAPGLLQEAAALAEEHEIPLVIHLAETRSEVDTITERYQKTPVGHLADLGILGPRTVACHCVALTEADIQLLARSNTKVAHNPESNMKLASGVAPVPQMLAAEICIGLGTDGCSSNNDLDLFAEMDTAAKLHKVDHLDPTVASAEAVLAMATREAARALGLGDEIGTLAVDKRADLIVIDTDKPHLTPMYNPISHLVYSVKGSDVTASVINGRVVMEKGELLTLDEAGAMAEALQAAEKIRP
jgi:5-methylthioadenosine/S-adenosylhomocysteine deaminase